MVFGGKAKKLEPNDGFNESTDDIGPHNNRGGIVKGSNNNNNNNNNNKTNTNETKSKKKALFACFAPMPLENIQVGVAWPGKRHQLNVTTHTKVGELKQKVFELEQMQVVHQKLFYKDKEMKKNSRTLGSYKVENDRTIVLKYSGPALPPARPKSLPASAFEGKLPNANVPKPATTATKPAASTSITANNSNNTHPQQQPSQQQPQQRSSISASNNKPAAAATTTTSSATTTTTHATHVSTQLANPSNNTTTATTTTTEQINHVDGNNHEGKISNKLAVPDNSGTNEGSTTDTEDRAIADVPLDVATTEKFVAKEEANHVIQFQVQHNSSTISLAMAANDDVWAVKLKLEAMHIAKAGHMTILDESGEELDDEGTLEELGIGKESVLILEVAD